MALILTLVTSLVLGTKIRSLRKSSPPKAPQGRMHRFAQNRDKVGRFTEITSWYPRAEMGRRT